MNIAENYNCLKEHVAELAKKAGRDLSQITIVTVSKNYSLSHIKEAYNAGCRYFGESRIQEAFEKIPNTPNDIKWHFVGTLQKNKVRKVLGHFELIHSVDSYSLAQKLSECSLEKGVETAILLQVNTSGELTKHGMGINECKREFEKIALLPNLKIEGLMTIAPLTENEKIIHQCFKDLRMLRDELGLIHLSMGMSHDYPIAIEEGASILRIGTAIFNSF